MNFPNLITDENPLASHLQCPQVRAEVRHAAHLIATVRKKANLYFLPEMGAMILSFCGNSGDQESDSNFC